MSYPNYATHYLDSDGFVRPFEGVFDNSELIQELDAQVENLSKGHKYQHDQIEELEEKVEKIELKGAINTALKVFKVVVIDILGKFIFPFALRETETQSVVREGESTEPSQPEPLYAYSGDNLDDYLTHLEKWTYDVSVAFTNHDERALQIKVA